MMKKQTTNYRIYTVEYALDVLEQFLDNTDELGMTELRKRLNLNKYTLGRLLATLASRSYIEVNNGTDCYRLGIRNLEMGQSAIKQMKLPRQARAVLESVVRDCNETTDVAIMRGSEIYCLDAVESSHPVRVVPRMGTMLPAHCTAAGKVLLANGSEADLQRYLSEDLRQLTMNTIIDRDQFRRLLSTIAAQDYALEDEELNLGVRSVAAPIRNYTGGVVGAVSVSGPIMRFNTARMYDELVPQVKRAAKEISLRLGYYHADTVQLSEG
ncbi:IclR family transcriptional regulator [Geobacter argillaceus]|uniref:IclR family transcriptional regulator n=1 Tax=Geobacter argillaceus TaxID=345631 RepID=A0A562V000_9BACT|nr:IclR family transcriptional regulator [Geobacter argillaceus]TWJ11270.1 IclR family transcriptional regulator [Geobacter argillaceus]